MLSVPSRSIWRSARSYACHAPSIISTTQSNSGLKISSAADDTKLTASISLILKAGSRYEPEPGFAHVLKNMVFKSTEKRSALSLVRESELLGGVLTASLSREHLILSAEFLKGNEGYFAEVLGDVLTYTKFSRHEFNEEAVPATIAEYNQAHLDSTVVALDRAHQLAFRTGLGNSLFADPHFPVERDSVIDFARSTFARSSQHAVIGAGVESEKLVDLVNQFFGASSSSPSSSSASESPKSTYHGGDARVASHSSDTFLMAFKASEKSSQPAYTVLQHLLGSDPASVKWSQGSAPLSALPVKSFHLPYSDIGLFGLIVQAPAPDAGSVASTAIAELKKVAAGVEKDAVARAAAKAQFLVASGIESNIIKTEALGTHSLNSSSAPQQLQDLYSSYAQVTADQVAQAAKSLLSSRPTTVAVGDVKKLPFPDELGFQ